MVAAMLSCPLLASSGTAVDVPTLLLLLARAQPSMPVCTSSLGTSPRKHKPTLQ